MFERLIADLGVDFFKLDYNVTPGPGTDRDAFTVGAGLLAHNRAHLDWVRVDNGAIAGFRTYLTGELFAAVRQTTLIGRDMGEPGGDDAGRRAGVDAVWRDGWCCRDLR